MAKMEPKETPSSRGNTPGIDWIVQADNDFAYTVRMSVEAWIRIPPHPMHRDVERHEKDGSSKFLTSLTGRRRDVLRGVVAAELDGQFFKLDGHVRAHLWKEKKLKRPDFVVALIYRCKSRQHVDDFYDSYHPSKAAQSSASRVVSACREQGIELRSERLKGGMFVEALSIAMIGRVRSKSKNAIDEINEREAVIQFREQILLIDRLNPPQEVFVTGVIAAAFLVLALSPVHMAFFSKLALKAGVTKNELRDPVAGILSLVEQLKGQEKSTWRRAAIESLSARCIAAAFIFEHGQTHPNYWSAEWPEPVVLPEIAERVRVSRGY